MKSLSKYEFARIIGARSLQLSVGAPPMVKVKEDPLNFISVATMEYEAGVLPLAVSKN